MHPELKCAIADIKFTMESIRHRLWKGSESLKIAQMHPELKCAQGGFKRTMGSI